ncbi:MAG: flagellar basal body rod protein FlgC [Chloroflexi bacterium]|nr:flagellar basal body rod protein FlgC [Chloroflexota bacterium]
MSIFNAFHITTSALTAQRLRMDVIANNIANAETTHTESGEAYQRQAVVFQPRGSAPHFALPNFVRGARADLQSLVGANGGVQVTEVVKNEEIGSRVYDPSHPDADEEGFVTYPNVNIVTEMTDMLSATRSYEANVTVLNAIKQMALKTLEIGRG